MKLLYFGVNEYNELSGYISINSQFFRLLITHDISDNFPFTSVVFRLDTFEKPNHPFSSVRFALTLSSNDNVSS